jgi:crossover junction endodeoxyribonuclease RusA
VGALCESITFSVEGIPASKGSYRPVTGRSRKTGKPVTRLIPMDKKERPWREKVRQTVLAAMTDNHFDGFARGVPVELCVGFVVVRPKTVRRYSPTVKPDLDKLLRCLMDGLTDSGIIHDDAQIINIAASKGYARSPDDHPGCVVRLTAIY